MALRDLIPRFEAVPTSEHVRNAVAAVQRLDNDGRSFWPAGSNQLSRWQRCCNDLLAIVNGLGKRRWGQKQDLPTALREFIAEFEHTTYRMLQMLSNRPDLEHIGLWCDFTYRLSTYALVSFWIDDKTEQLSIHIEMTFDRTAGKTVTLETKTLKPMRCHPSIKKQPSGFVERAS